MTTGTETRRAPRRTAFLVAVATFAPAWAGARTPAAPAAPASPPPDAGLRIYRDGILPSGRPLEGVAQRGIPRSGADAACAACHRRSGYGASEGAIRIPSIAATTLRGGRAIAAAPPGPASMGTAPANAAAAAQAARVAVRNARLAALSGSPRRPPYDDAALARAIRDGVDVTGRRLGPGMPRYDLGGEDMKALLAYLRTLSVEPPPGVTAEELHFATVVLPGVDPARRRSMVEVLEAFIRDKNAGTRSEAQRRDAGTDRMSRAYRTWVLHVWELTGPADGWGRELDALQGRQPVFALLAGMGTSSWRPVHDWSERHGVPCLFPQIDVPVTDGGFYTVYLSRGIALEAEALAKYLRESPPGAVTQVFRRDGTSAVAAAAFRSAMVDSGVTVDERALDATPDLAFWDRLAAEKAGSTIVLWLPRADLADAVALVAPDSPVSAVFLSSTLVGDGRRALAGGDDARVRLVLPLDLPSARAARLLRVKRWLHDRDIVVSDERVQLNAYFAVAVTADVVTHMADLFSREYLVERIEHVVGNTVTPSLYPRVSLGPDQRFASKGSFIVKPGAGAGDVQPVSGWITP